MACDKLSEEELKKFVSKVKCLCDGCTAEINKALAKLEVMILELRYDVFPTEKPGAKQGE